MSEAMSVEEILKKSSEAASSIGFAMGVLRFSKLTDSREEAIQEAYHGLADAGKQHREIVHELLNRIEELEKGGDA